MTVRTLFHFTAPYRAGHLGQILRDGVLKTTESNCSREREHAGPDVVWLLDTSSAIASEHGIVYREKTLGRVTVQVADAEPWQTWAARHCEPYMRRMLPKVAGGARAAGHWYVVARPIPRSEWLSVDRLVNGAWCRVASARELPTLKQLRSRASLAELTYALQ